MTWKRQGGAEGWGEGAHSGILDSGVASSLRCQPEQTPETINYAELVEQESPFQFKSPASGHFEVEGRLARDVFRLMAQYLFPYLRTYAAEEAGCFVAARKSKAWSRATKDDAIFHALSKVDSQTNELSAARIR